MTDIPKIKGDTNYTQPTSGKQAIKREPYSLRSCTSTEQSVETLSEEEEEQYLSPAETVQSESTMSADVKTLIEFMQEQQDKRDQENRDFKKQIAEMVKSVAEKENTELTAITEKLNSTEKERLKGEKMGRHLAAIKPMRNGEDLGKGMEEYTYIQDSS